jgi:hypothetical protein
MQAVHTLRDPFMSCQLLTCDLGVEYPVGILQPIDFYLFLCVLVFGLVFTIHKFGLTLTNLLVSLVLDSVPEGDKQQGIVAEFLSEGLMTSARSRLHALGR